MCGTIVMVTKNKYMRQAGRPGNTIKRVNSLVRGDEALDSSVGRLELPQGRGDTAGAGAGAGASNAKAKVIQEATICANCDEDDHDLSLCPRPKADDLVHGCARGNPSSHTVDECEGLSSLSAKERMDLLLNRRANMPALKTKGSLSWVERLLGYLADNGKATVHRYLAWSEEFGKSIASGPIINVVRFTLENFPMTGQRDEMPVDPDTVRWERVQKVMGWLRVYDSKKFGANLHAADETRKTRHANRVRRARENNLAQGCGHSGHGQKPGFFPWVSRSGGMPELPGPSGYQARAPSPVSEDHGISDLLSPPRLDAASHAPVSRDGGTPDLPGPCGHGPRQAGLSAHMGVDVMDTAPVE